jgi:hypothetical protein
MSHSMTERVWADTSLKTPGERLVMLALSHSYNPKYGCFPSLEVLIEKTQLSREWVLNILDRLGRKGLIKKIPGGGRGRTNRYELYPEPELDLREETVNSVDPLTKHKQSTLSGETVNSVGINSQLCRVETVNSVGINSQLCRVETVNSVDPFPLVKGDNFSPPNSNITVNNSKSGRARERGLSLSENKKTAGKKAKRRRRTQPFKAPTLEEFISYGQSKGISDQDCRDQYEIWTESEWHDGNGTAISRWKGKLVTQKRIGNLPSDKRARNGPRPSSANRETKSRHAFI